MKWNTYCSHCLSGKQQPYTFATSPQTKQPFAGLVKDPCYHRFACVFFWLKEGLPRHNNKPAGQMNLSCATIGMILTQEVNDVAK